MDSSNRDRSRARKLTVRSVVAGLVVLVCSHLPELWCQARPGRDTSETRRQADLEGILEQISQDSEDSELIELLARLQEDPLELNDASAEELQQVPGISSILAFNILSFRAKKPFTRVEELLRVEGITPDLLERVRPFVRVTEAESRDAEWPAVNIALTSRMVRDVQRRRGFQDGTYQGTPLKVYNRIVGTVRPGWEGPGGIRGVPGGFRPTVLELGIVTEKDAGERDIADHLAGYGMVTIPGISARLLIGDYVVESGEGLVFWRSVGLSKGTEVISSVRKNGGGVRPFLSAEENRYFRGAAAMLSFGDVDLAFVYSNKALNASADSEGVITSFDNSGLFRSESELLRRNRSRERLLGVRAAASPWKGTKVGLSANTSRFADPVRLSDGFRGQTANALGLDISYTDRWLNVFSEIARDHQNLYSGVGGILLKPVAIVDVSCVVRRYPRDFVSLHGYGFGEFGGGVENESGVYLGVAIRPISWVKLSLYYDQFNTFWKTSTSRFPLSGHDVLAFSEIVISPRLSFQLQFKEKIKGSQESILDSYGRVGTIDVPRTQRNYRATAEYRASKAFRWKSRVELVTTGYRTLALNERGALLLQDLRFNPLPGLLVDARAIAFQTDSFDSRVYEYESELPGTFSNPALFGRGLRWYLLARYELSTSADIWVKYSQTIKDGVRAIGSGASEIAGDREGRISVQANLRW